MRIPTFILLAVLTVAGCDPDGGWNDPQADTPITPARPANAGATEDHSAVMATVNGHPIYMDALHTILVANFGLPTAQHLIMNEVVAQHAENEGIAATEEDIQLESNQAMARLAPEGFDDDAQRQQLLDRLLAERGLSRAQWMEGMERQVLLRKMAADQVNVTDDDLKDEYERQYGRRVQVRHIELVSLAAAQQVQMRLEDGDEFVNLVRSFSENPSKQNDGLLPPISYKSVDVPPAIRQAAVVLTDVGEVSQPIQVGTHYHLLQLVKVFPSEEAEFDLVKDQLREAVREAQVQRLRQVIFRDIVRNADIEFADPILRKQAAARQAQP